MTEIKISKDIRKRTENIKKHQLLSAFSIFFLINFVAPVQQFTIEVKTMARNDYIIEKPDSSDVKEFDSLIKKVLLAKRKIEDGFLELAESIFYINKKKLYKLHYKTFSEFCEEGLGFSRQTIYVYLGILKLITTYPDHFPRKKAIEFGHKK